MHTASVSVTVAAPSTGGQILGSIGTGGGALIITAFLVLGIFGNGRINLDHDRAYAWGFVAGLLYAIAGDVWTAPADVSEGIAQSIQEGFGDTKMGAIAILFVLFAYGLQLKKVAFSAVLGILTPPIFTAAGGIFAILTTVLSSALNQAVA